MNLIPESNIRGEVVYSVRADWGELSYGPALESIHLSLESLETTTIGFLSLGRDVVKVDQIPFHISEAGYLGWKSEHISVKAKHSSTKYSQFSLFVDSIFVNLSTH